MSDFGIHKNPVAAKAHRCEWCGEPIFKGEQHYQYTGVWQGDWQNWRMHTECHDYSTLNNDVDDGFSPYENERPFKVPEQTAPSTHTPLAHTDTLCTSS